VVVVVAVLAAGVLVVLTRGDSDVALTESEMEDALLTADEVGSGFTEDTDDDDDDSSDSDDLETDDIDASEECLDLLERLEEEEAGQDLFFSDGLGSEGPTAQRAFESDDDVNVDHTLARDSSDVLGSFRELVSTCDEMDFDDGETVGTLRFTETDPVDVGDDNVTLDYSLSFTEPFEVDIDFLWVIWSRDGTIGGVSITGAIDDELNAGEPDRELFEATAEKADAKLEEVIDDAR